MKGREGHACKGDVCSTGRRLSHPLDPAGARRPPASRWHPSPPRPLLPPPPAPRRAGRRGMPAGAPAPPATARGDARAGRARRLLHTAQRVEPHPAQQAGLRENRAVAAPVSSHLGSRCIQQAPVRGARDGLKPSQLLPLLGQSSLSLLKHHRGDTRLQRRHQRILQGGGGGDTARLVQLRRSVQVRQCVAGTKDTSRGTGPHLAAGREPDELAAAASGGGRGCCCRGQCCAGDEPRTQKRSRL